MTIDIPTALEGLGGAVTAIGGVYAAVRHMKYSAQNKKDRYRQQILEEGKIEIDKVRDHLEERIGLLEVELKSQKESVSKDFSHLKEVYNQQISVLADKIESLRSDLSDHTKNMVALLTKLVDNK